MAPAPAAAVAPVSVLLLPAPSNTAALAKKELLAYFKAEGIAFADVGSDAEQVCAFVKAVGSRVEETDTNSDGANMERICQLLTRVCEYAEMVVQTWSGARAAARDTKPVCHDAKDDADAAPPAVATAAFKFDLPVPVKSEEIRPARETPIKPYDMAFQDLQSGLRQLMERSEVLRATLNALVVKNNDALDMLDKIEVRMFHRVDRARARHIMYVAKLEEEWLMDPVSIAVNEAPCAECAKDRAITPRLKQPLPKKAPIAASTTTEN